MLSTPAVAPAAAPMFAPQPPAAAPTPRRLSLGQGDELIEQWVYGKTLEERLLAIFAVAGKKLSSDEAAWVWQKMIALSIGQVEPDVADQLIRQFIRLAPESAMAHKLYDALMNANPRPAELPPMVFMITSCRRYLAKAERLQRELTARGAHARIMIGEPGLRAARSEGVLVRLPVSDAYEALPHKVLEGLTWVRQNYGALPAAKIDDDIQLAPEFTPRALAMAAEEMQYVGELWGSVCDRAWHLGKTAAPTPIYGRRLRGLFAYGPMYLLGSRAVEHLVREWVYYPGELEGRTYEDRAIGEMLAEAGIALNHVPIAQMGGIVSSDERFVKRPY